MADGHGGKRTPAHPAAVSGPGKFSARTDGKPTVGALDSLSSGKYGETQALSQVAGGAPVSAPSGPSMGNQALGAALSQGGLGFGAGTAQPNTPVTAGSQYGPGPGPEALTANDPTATEAQHLAQQGVLPVLIHMADQDDATPYFKQYVRQLLGALPSS